MPWQSSPNSDSAESSRAESSAALEQCCGAGPEAVSVGCRPGRVGATQ